LHVHIDGLETATPGIRFVPEAGPAAIAQEGLPPDAMRLGARPRLQRVEIAPVLRIPKWRSENSRFSWSSRPSGLAATEPEIFGPNPKTVLMPVSALTRIPR
jgi:hypothetical protein